MPIKKLFFGLLKEEMPGMEPAIGESCAHAAGVCLEYGNHKSGETSMDVDGSKTKTYALGWEAVSDQMRRSWADLQDATEWGASGVAALLVEDIYGYQILQRYWKGTGFDYWVGNSDNRGVMFQDKARLEVTGILNGTEGDISIRLREKQDRLAKYPNDLPSMVVVVEFGAPRSRIAEE